MKELIEKILTNKLMRSASVLSALAIVMSVAGDPWDGT